MILVRNTIPHHRIVDPIPCGVGVEVMAVELTLPNLHLTVYNIYRKSDQVLDASELLAMVCNQPCLVGGDFNAHHPVLNSTKTDPAGTHLNQLLEDLPAVSLLNTGEPTHIRGGRLDLTFTSDALAARANWVVHPTLTSDHFAILTSLMVDGPPIPLPLPRWDLKRADWPLFQKTVDNWWATYSPAEDLDARSAEFTGAITAAADKAIPKTKPGRVRHRKWWFYTEEVRRHNQRVNDARKIFKKNPTPETRTFLKEIVYRARQVAKEARTTCWLEWCASFNQHTNLATLWSKLKIATGRPAPRPPAHPQPLEEAERLITIFQDRSASTTLPPSVQQKLGDLQPIRMHSVGEACALDDDADVPFTQWELEEARKGRRDTAPGSDGITYSMLRCAGRAGDMAFLSLFNHSWRLGRSPADWKEGDIVTISKHSAPTKLRPLTMLKCPGKTAESMVLNRLRWRVGDLHPHLFGFVRGSSTSDCIMTLLSKIDHRHAIVVFLDIEKAFELACPAAILDALVRKRVRGRMLAWIKDYLSGRKSRVRYQGSTSTYKDFENGTPQGGILSPFLFNLLMDLLVRILLPNGALLLSYADDLVLVVSGKTPYKVDTAQQALNLITTKCTELGFKISVEKSRAMSFNKQTPRQRLTIQGTQLVWVGEHQYLGVWLDTWSTYKKQVEYLAGRVKARHNVMRAMTHPSAGTTSTILRQFYVHAIRPLIDYSSPVLVDISGTQQLILEKTQNAAMRTILGAPRWTHIGTLLAETGLTSLKLRIQQLVAGKVARIMQRDHGTVVRQRLGGLRNFLRKSKWISAVAQTFTTLVPHWQRLAADADLQDPSYTPPPPWEPPAVDIRYTVLPGTRAQCTSSEMRQHALQWMDTLHQPDGRVYYTDGSVDPTTGATGSAFIAGDQVVGWRNSDHSSSLQTELAAIHGALRHAMTEGSRHIVVHTDSKAALQVLQRSYQRDNIALSTTILGLAQQMAAEGQVVLLNWIPSHVGLAGNDRADTAAKQASTHLGIEKHLRPSLSYTRTVARVEARKETYQRHRQMINTSRSMRWYAGATDFQPLSSALQKLRSTETAAYRLRLGYRTYAERVRPHEVHGCQHCGALAEFQLQHYLLYCPFTADLRIPALPADRNGPEVRAMQVVMRACNNPTTLINVLCTATPPR